MILIFWVIAGILENLENAEHLHVSSLDCVLFMGQALR